MLSVGLYVMRNGKCIACRVRAPAVSMFRSVPDTKLRICFVLGNAYLPIQSMSSIESHRDMLLCHDCNDVLHPFGSNLVVNNRLFNALMDGFEQCI